MIKNLFIKKIALFLALFSGIEGLSVRAVRSQQIIAAPDGTMTVVTPDGNRFVIDGGTLSGDGRNLFHSFQEFGLSAEQIATFLSNPSIENILSRITGGNPSIINGTIEVLGGNSNLFLMNPAGIIFGTGATLNVPADFTATTATGIGFDGGWFNAFGNNDYSNLVGNPNGFQFQLDPAGAIINAGELTVKPGQNLSLLGGVVVNTGTLQAPDGKITMTAVTGTNLVRLSQEGQILSLEIEPPKSESGDPLPVRGLDLPTLLTGSGNVETGLQVTANGEVQLTESGTIIPTNPGTAIVSGQVDASSAEALGGEISLLGDRVGIIDANIDASGQTGGGTVLIGGDYQGQGTVPNAQVTVINENSTIRADAIENGDGGRVIAWADKTTAFSGNISTRGGENSGNGGFVEVSGQDNLIFRGNVDLSATNGNSGTLFLDPTDITIANGGEQTNDSELADSQILAGDSPGATFTISEVALENTSGNVVLQATNNITVNDLTDNGLTISGNSITFNADADADGAGAFSMNSGDTIQALGRNVTISGASLTVGAIDTSSSTANGGAVNLAATGNITTGTILSGSQAGNGGDITLTSNNGSINTTASSLTVEQIEATFGPAIDISDIQTFTGLVSGALVNGGKIQLTAAGNITTGNLLSSSLLQGQGGAITLNSTTGAIDAIAAQDFNANIATAQGQIQRQFAGIDASAPAGTGLGTLQVSASNLSLSSNIFTDGNIIINSNLSLGDSAIASTGGRGNGIGISGQINGQNGQQSLNLEAGTGSVVLLSPINGLSSLAINADTIRIDDIGNSTTAGVSEATNLNATTAIAFTGNIYNANQQTYTAGNDFNIIGGSATFISSGDNITFGPGTINLFLPSLPALTILSNGGNVTIQNARITTTLATVPNEQSILSLLTPGETNNGNSNGNPGNSIRTGFNTNTLERNDDGSTGLVPIGFRVSFFGRESDQAYVNNNGNITFDQALATFTPFDLTTTGQLIIAPFFADVDTRNQASGVTTYGTGTVNGRQAFGVTWVGVGYFSNNVDKTNSFQVVLIDRSDTGANNFDVEFNYNQIQWETGDASGGNNGLGGNSARVGFSNGTNQPGTFFELQGSAVNGAFLDGNSETGLINRSLNSDQLGRYVFEARSGIVGTPNPNITIDAGTGLVSTGNLGEVGQPLGDVNLSGASGITTGNIIANEINAISTQGSIVTGDLNTSSTILNGGNILLDASGDIVSSTINAQGSSNGSGGDVTITTDQFFRATNTFLDQNNIPASISTAGGLEPGVITITHGGQGVVPFVVGDATLNGTAGAITDGNFTITSDSFPFNEFEGSIAILSGIQPPEEPGETPQEPGETPQEPVNPQQELLDETQENSDPGQFQSNPPTQIQAAAPVPVIPIATVDQAREILSAIEREAAVKPVLIYVNFEPAGISLEQDFARREAGLTSEYEGFLNLPQNKALPTVTVPPSGTDQLELLAITAEGEPIRVRVPEATREVVLPAAEKLYQQVSELGDDYLDPAQQLYGWLIAPLEDELRARGIENYVFIMPDGLRLVPLAALHDGKQYMAQKYSTGFAPSLNLIDYRYRDIKESPVLAFGASEFESDENQTSLPAVQIEVPLIAQDIRQGKFVLDQEFTLQNLIANREDNPYPIIHLATHADFQPGELSQSYIQLYNEKIGLNELRELGLNQPIVDLLVISACRSAYGDSNSELGFAGLAVQAGVKTAIASLWYVGDTGTLGLMSEFYRQLANAPIKAEALRSAQVSMIEGKLKKQGNEIISTRGTVPLPAEAGTGEEDLTHPFYWAAFTMIGSPW
jgi:filamentous hemagglutinin family protein